jgi:hypothetical protein
MKTFALWYDPSSLKTSRTCGGYSVFRALPPLAFPQINLFRAQLFTGAGDYFSSGNDLANFLRADSTDTTPAKGSYLISSSDSFTTSFLRRCVL